jgi:altronate dehydratase large subunit
VSVPDRQDEFLGYRRSDGRVGTRNHLLVLSVNGLVAPAARRLARQIAGARLVATPYGRGQFGPDADAQRAQLVGLGRNPNVGAVLVVGADRRSVDAIAQAIAASGKPVETAALDDVAEDALAGARPCRWRRCSSVWNAAIPTRPRA